MIVRIRGWGVERYDPEGEYEFDRTTEKVDGERMKVRGMGDAQER